ncbi:hypothetical protein BR93DRAFT_56900 [Coniochaeta sp. PMI_546]|nr:hypothetical protein BR93DRAFT_56900 [Coniochaeta sp. PMI_546]
MPFSCAKAVCATFCRNIAGALIPIFGPQFPSECVHPDAPDHGRMCIDPAVVAEATVEAEGYRRLYAEQISRAAPTSPRHPHQHQHNNFQDRIPRQYTSSSSYQFRQHLRGGDLPDSPYTTDADEYEGFSGSESALQDADVYRLHQSRYPYTPIPTFRAVQTAGPTSTGWTASNHLDQDTRHGPSDHHASHGAQCRDQQHDHANPFLSALPRLPEHIPQSSPSQRRHYRPVVQRRHCKTSATRLLLAGSEHIGLAAPPTPVMSPKRPRAVFESTVTGHGGDSDQSYVGSRQLTSFVGRGPRDSEGAHQSHRDLCSRPELRLPAIGVSVTATIAERNAALLLMNLSMTESIDGVNTAGSGEKHTVKAGGSLPWATVLHDAVSEVELSPDDRPVKKQRRTISV